MLAAEFGCTFSSTGSICSHEDESPAKYRSTYQAKTPSDVNQALHPPLVAAKWRYCNGGAFIANFIDQLQTHGIPIRHYDTIYGF
ncbi:hypothetical protein ACNKHP_18935 [Shigella boydii]